MSDRASETQKKQIFSSYLVVTWPIWIWVVWDPDSGFGSQIEFLGGSSGAQTASLDPKWPSEILHIILIWSNN